MKKMLFVPYVLGALVAFNAQSAPSRRSVTEAPFQKNTSDHRVGRFEIEPQAGVAFLSPGDINGLVRDNNDAYQQIGFKSFSANEFGSSIGFGIAGTYRVMPALGLGVGFSRLSSTSSASGKVGDETLNVDYGVAANFLTAEARIIPVKSADGRFEGVISPFVGVGFFSSNGNYGGTYYINRGGSQEVESSAAGAVFGSNFGARYWVLDYLSVGLNAGYRFAKSGDLKVDRQKNSDQAVGTAVDVKGKKIRMDASSFVLGAGVTFSL